MRAGKLRFRIDIQKRVITSTDNRGQPVICWNTVYENIPAEIITLTGREVEYAHEIHPTATHQVKTRYLSGIDETYQIVWGCRTFGIGAVLTGDRFNDNRNLGLTFLCQERKA